MTNELVTPDNRSAFNLDDDKFKMHVVDKNYERKRVLATPIPKLTIDEIIEYRLDDIQFFGHDDHEGDNKRHRMYFLNHPSDVRTRRMIASIQEPHEAHGLLKPVVTYLSIQHGVLIECMDNEKIIKEITRLKNIIKSCGNRDLKDECDTLTNFTLSLKYGGKKRPKIGFLLPQREWIKDQCDLRGMSEEYYTVISSIYSCKTSDLIEDADYCDWLIDRYKFKLDNRKRELDRIVQQTNADIL
jgi:hypothetical protein